MGRSYQGLLSRTLLSITRMGPGLDSAAGQSEAKAKDHFSVLTMEHTSQHAMASS